MVVTFLWAAEINASLKVCVLRLIGSEEKYWSICKLKKPEIKAAHLLIRYFHVCVLGLQPLLVDELIKIVISGSQL